MLFQKNVVKKYIAALSDEAVSSAWQKYQVYFLDEEIQANIQQSKEEQFQEGFLRELFVKVLGYTLNPSPNYNLITEKKNETNAQKADGAILLDGKVIGVIELKDHKTTDLSKIEKQAFGYKNQHRDACYVIISNFEKLRFYIDNAVDYREWNLFTMTEQEFRELYLCIAWQQMEMGVALKIKSDSVSSEDQITNELYRDYSQFKRILFADILKNNPIQQGDEKEWQLLLFKKTQKLLDRFLFIFFAEDCGLLPPNSIVRIVEQWRKLKDDYDEYRPLYERIKKYFGYLDTGHQGRKENIFAYNGGLFKTDEILNSLSITDEVLEKHTLKLATYDFESDVDVNILGHIFENSLSEIEEVTQQITNGQAPTTSKRKQDGVFYTPQYITKYIVENTVGRLCQEKKQTLNIKEEEYFSDRKRQKQTKQHLLEQLRQYREWLLQITILDPACGSGAFLNAALRFLMDEHKLIDEMETKVSGYSIQFQDVENSILENNLYGVDINEESVEIAQLALWLRTAKPHRKLNSLNQNIKCGNSLISDPAVAGDKAFDWQKEFPQVFEKGGFDVVIGNPPYVQVGCIPVKDKEYYKTVYKSSYKRSDLFALFVEKGLMTLSKSDGKVAFIIPSIVLNNLSYQPLRDIFLNNNWLNEVSYVGGGVFADATVDTSILVFDKCSSTNITLRHAVDFLNPIIRVVESGYFKTYKNIISISENGSDSIADKLFNPMFTSVGEHFYVFQGIVTGNNDTYLFSSDKDASEKGIETTLLHPFVFGRDIGKWEMRTLEHKVLYVDKFFEIEKYPSTKKWLLSFKETLSKRRECVKGTIPWYSLQWPRVKSDLDTREKILIQRTRNESLKTRIVATLDNTGVYSAESIINVIPKDSTVSLYYFIAILNSKLINFLFATKFLNLAVKGEYLKQVKIPNLSLDAQQPFVTLADTMLSLHKQLQEKRSRFLRRLSENFEGVKITTALQTFDQLEFKAFVAELKKQKIKLSLAQQDEWEDYFSQYRNDCQQLSEQIAQTDKEIDLRVYNLYGLTYDEVLIVDPETPIMREEYEKH